MAEVAPPDGRIGGLWASEKRGFGVGESPGDAVTVHCPECRRTHPYTAPVFPCACGSPVAAPLLPDAPARPVRHRNWLDEWVTVRCGTCGREDDWPQPELGCACGTVLRIAVAPVRPVPPGASVPPVSPEASGVSVSPVGPPPQGEYEGEREGYAAAAGDPGASGTAGAPERPGVPGRPGAPGGQTAPGGPAAPEGPAGPGGPGAWGASATSGGPNVPEDTDAAGALGGPFGPSAPGGPFGLLGPGSLPHSPDSTESTASSGPTELSGLPDPSDPSDSSDPFMPLDPSDPFRPLDPFDPFGPDQLADPAELFLLPEDEGPVAPRSFAERYPARVPPLPAVPRPAAERGTFRPVTIRTARDAVAAAASYLDWLGFREIVQPEDRHSAGVDLRGPGLVAQVDPSTRPAGLRAVECLWLNGLSASAVSVFFSLAGYTPEARSRAAEIALPLFVLDLTGTPQPVNNAADELTSGGAV